MRAPVSVVIPTLNAAAGLPACLAALMEGVDAGLIREVIISDGGSTDATGAIAQAWGAEWVEGPASRGAQIGRGCVAAQGDWLLVLHADTVLGARWSEAVAAHLGAPKAAWFRLRFDRGGVPARLVAGWANLRSRLGLPYGDQGLLIAAQMLDGLGGYPDLPLMEDVTLARALRGQMTALDAVAVTSAEKYRQQGWVGRGGRNLWLLTRYFIGASPDELARKYRKR